MGSTSALKMGESLKRNHLFHVEVSKHPKSRLKRQEIEAFVKASFEKLEDPTDEINLENEIFADIRVHVGSVRVYKETQSLLKLVKVKIDAGPVNGNGAEENLNSGGGNFTVKYHTFELNEGGEEEEYMDDDEEDGGSPASHQWILPSKAFDGLWDSLIFDSDIKSRLMEYVNTALLFSEKGVNSSLITWNKVILLHGPPGTGKTSLCKALAQKATIRLGNRFRYGQLIEINSHSLFSKWFSESGKLVMKMFEKIHQLIEDPQALIFLLIDEVESLAQCRQSAEAGNEPSDSIRAVNALLTQIDRIKRYPNVMVLTTSNVVGAIDLAFVDRADLKIFIGPPPPSVIYEIYSSSINELIRVGIIDSETFLPNKAGTDSTDEHKLLAIAVKSQNMSGRTLRKIPFLTHVNFIRQESCSLEVFLESMAKAVETEVSEAKALIKSTD